MTKKQLRTQGKIKVTKMKYRDLKQIMKAYGWVEARVCNSTHMMFVHKETGEKLSVSGNNCTCEYPIVQKTLKAIGAI